VIASVPSRRGALSEIGLSTLAGVAPVVVLGPLAAGIAGGIGTPRRLGLAVLLLETVYLLAVYVLLGLRRPRSGVIAALLPAVPAALALVATVSLGGSARDLAAAQPAAAAVALLAWGIGRAARDGFRGSGAATGVALLILSVLALSVLPLSHVASRLEATPLLIEGSLAVNPFVLVTSAAGHDLIRTDRLYDGLTLAGYRFRYPHPIAAPIVLALAGAILGRMRPRRRRTPRSTPLRDVIDNPALHSSREEVSG
jgi:hypothetical protein